MAGEGKGNGDGGKTGSSTRMVTRLRNPDSKLSQRKVMQDKDASSQDSKALKDVSSTPFAFSMQSAHMTYNIIMSKMMKQCFNAVFTQHFPIQVSMLQETSPC